MDRAVLDAALLRGVPCGGWCPAGRLAEDGPIAGKYPLNETPSPDYAERTLANVRDSEGTLILVPDLRPGESDAMSPGTRLTAEAATRLGRPLLMASLAVGDPGAGSLTHITGWIGENEISVLNIAGPRESECPGIYEAAHALILSLFAAASDS